MHDWSTDIHQLLGKQKSGGKPPMVRYLPDAPRLTPEQEADPELAIRLDPLRLLMVRPASLPN